jgi:hypothetical protein
MEHHAKDEPREKQPREQALDVKRDMTRIASRQRRLVSMARELEGNLRARVADADDERRARLDLCRIAVLQRVQLNDRGIEVSANPDTWGH